MFFLFRAIYYTIYLILQTIFFILFIAYNYIYDYILLLFEIVFNQMRGKTMGKENAKITNINELQNVLGVKMEKVRKTNATLSEKAQVMQQVNSAMHNLLCEQFPQYYNCLLYTSDAADE